METYKSIKDYDNYEVSNLGNVRNKKTGKILKQYLQNEYYKVGLSVNGKSKQKRVHRLLALSFIPKLHNKSFVDHIDKNSLNNNIGNLRWVSLSENKMNSSKYKNNTSSQTGVYFRKDKNKWEVKISVNGIKKHIGYYTNFDEAIAARKEQEDIHYKEFQAFQNEIDRLEFEFQQAIK